MSQKTYMTDRFVLRPGTGKRAVERFVGVFKWSLVEDTLRDESHGVDGLTEWEAPNLGSFFYCEDADFGVPYFALSGFEKGAVDALADHARKILNPWKLTELYQLFDNADTVRQVMEGTLLIGIGAPNIFTEGVFSRIKAAMEMDDENARWMGVWATTYTGYNEFIPTIRHVRDADSVDWVRDRAENVLGVFEDMRESQ